MSNVVHKLKLGALVALVVGSMIGGGIFSLPQNVAKSAGPGAALIGWLITGVGMLMMAFVFQALANLKPELNNGVYAYAKAGFGNYMGFSSAWGYWLSAWLGNVSYIVLIFSTLSYFFPIFGDGNNVSAIIAASILLWLFHFLVLKGVKTASFINTIVTVAKIVPIITFIGFVFIAFKANIFTADIWAKSNPNLGSVLEQVKGMMLVTVWVFIGIEGASVYSARAEKRSDIGKATVIGFVFVLAILVMVNLLSLGVMQQPELAKLRNPSMAYVLEYIAGPWGAAFINIGLIISLFGALMAWIMFSAEILFSAAQDQTMPKFLAKANRNEIPSNSLLLTNICTQIFLIITLFSKSTYTSLFTLATSMILVPYLFCSAYALKIAILKDGYGDNLALANKHKIIALISTIYAVWLLYASGWQYVLLSALLYAPGALLFVKARREQNKYVFEHFEKILCAASVAGALVALYGLYAGWLSIS